MSDTIDLPKATDKFIREIQQMPAGELISQEEEYVLVLAYQKDKNHFAGTVLIERYLPLVHGVVSKIPQYKSSYDDMVGDGVVGAYQALKGFDVGLGYRFSTHARWHIIAAVTSGRDAQDHVLKTGTTKVRKFLTKHLGHIDNKFQRKYPDLNQCERDEQIVNYFAGRFTNNDIQEARGLRDGVSSLDAIVGGEDGGTTAWVDWLEADVLTGEQQLVRLDEKKFRQSLVAEAFDLVRGSERDRDIFISRRMNDGEGKITLGDLSDKYGISRERVRQIEVRFFSDLEAKVRTLARQKGVSAPAPN